MDDALKHKIYRNVGRIQGRCEELGYFHPGAVIELNTIYAIAEEIYREVFNASKDNEKIQQTCGIYNPASGTFLDSFSRDSNR